MPRIPDQQLNNVFYLYPTYEAAKAGEGAGGTGFAVSIDSSIPGQGWIYAVSNYHVVIGVDGPGNPVIRLNTRDGGHDIIELGPEDWEFDPDTGTDIAVARMRRDEAVHDCPVTPVNIAFLTPEFVSKQSVGVGDEVFMIGRFVDHDGGETNRPAARFGHISIMPSPLLREHSGKYVDSFCIDMNSRTGYSGSPVWVYRTPGRTLKDFDFKTAKVVTTGGTFLMLLGIHYGQFPEFWKIEDGKVVAVATPNATEPTVGSDKQIRGMSGMTCVLPAWRIVEILNRPKFKTLRDRDEARIASERTPSDPSPEAA